MTVETVLARGLKTSVFGSQWNVEHGENLALLDPDRIKSDLLANRPAAAVAHRFFFATDNQKLYYDTGSAWVDIAAVVAAHAAAHASGGGDAITITEAQVTGLVADLALKAPLASPTFTGSVAGITAAMVGAPAGSGTSSGANTGDQTTVSGNAATATALQTARTIDGQSFNGTANITVVAPATAAATAKTAIVDADYIPLVDTEAANVLKKSTWTSIKAFLKTYFDTLYVALTGNQTIAGVKTFSTAGGAVITGVTDASAAAAGVVGEVLTIRDATAITPAASNAWKTVTQLTLTPGDWLITGSIYLQAGATSAITTLFSEFSLTDNAQDSYASGAVPIYYTAPVPINASLVLPINAREFSISANTIIYLVAGIAYTTLGGATFGAGGSGTLNTIIARRIR